MDSINETQKEFFETLSYIQEFAVNQALSEHHREKCSLEDVLYSATYEVIERICELLDGYGGNPRLELDLIDKKSNIPLRTGIELHDDCADYVKWEDPYKGKCGDSNT